MTIIPPTVPVRHVRCHCWLVQQCWKHGWTSQPWHPSFQVGRGTRRVKEAGKRKGEHMLSAPPGLPAVAHRAKGFPGHAKLDFRARKMERKKMEKRGNGRVSAFPLPPSPFRGVRGRLALTPTW